MYVYIYICVYVYINNFICKCLCVYIYTYMYMNTCIYTHIFETTNEHTVGNREGSMKITRISSGQLHLISKHVRSNYRNVHTCLVHMCLGKREGRYFTGDNGQMDYHYTLSKFCTVCYFSTENHRTKWSMFTNGKVTVNSGICTYPHFHTHKFT